MNLPRKIASGVAINVAFTALTGLVAVGNILIIARLLAPEDMGLFVLASTFVEAFVMLSDFGTKEKFVQEGSLSPEATFKAAFTLNLLMAILLAAIILAIAPVAAKLYDNPQLWPLLSLLSLIAFTETLTLPLAVYYRELDFLRYRIYPVAGKVGGFLLTALLAYWGAGVWSLALGTVSTLLITAVPLWVGKAFRPGFVSLACIRSYVGFSLPYWASRVTGVITMQGAVFTISAYLSVKELGHFRLAEQLAGYAFLIEAIIGQTIFPALCRLQESDEELRKIFATVSKISMVWAAPFGMGLFVFANDLVTHLFSEKWRGMELMLKVQGGAVLFGSIAYAWDNFLKAKGTSRPTLVAATGLAVTFLTVFVPAVAVLGYGGIPLGIGAIVVVGLVIKKYYMERLFPGISIFGIVAPEIVSALGAGIVVLAWKGMHASDGGGLFAMRVSLFGAAYLLSVVLFERDFIKGIPAFLASVRRPAL